MINDVVIGGGVVEFDGYAWEMFNFFAGLVIGFLVREILEYFSKSSS